MPRKHPLDKRHAEIAERLVYARKAWRCSRADLSHLAKVDSEEIARAELGRTPLRFNTAWKLARYLDINPHWLATGQGDWRRFPVLPPLSELHLDENAPFIEEYSKHLESVLRPVPSKGTGRSGDDFEADILERLQVIKSLEGVARNWFVKVPKGSIYTFLDDLKGFAKDKLSALPQDDWRQRARREVELNELEKRLIIIWEQYQKDEAGLGVDSSSLKSNTAGMNSEIERLIQRVRRVVSKPGAKAELARTLEVAPARISEWLSGAKEPGGEYTLRLLNWVQQRERGK